MDKPTPAGWKVVHDPNTLEDRVRRLELLVNDVMYMIGAKIKEQPKDET